MSNMSFGEVERWTLRVIPETVHLSMGNVPLTIYGCQGGYSGMYKPIAGEIRLQVPGGIADADRIVVLYILLHEYAHCKHATIGPQSFLALTSDYRAVDSAQIEHPVDVMAHKHAIRAMVGLGIPPSIIADRLLKAGLDIFIPQALAAKSPWARKCLSCDLGSGELGSGR